MIATYTGRVLATLIVFAALIGLTVREFDRQQPARAQAVSRPSPTGTPAPDEAAPVGREAPLGRYVEPAFEGTPRPPARAVQSPLLAPTPLVSFEGVEMERDSQNSLHSPPDTHAAVGMDRIVAVTNGHVAIYNKMGSLLAGGDAGSGAVDLDAFCGAEGCFDPKVIYDQYAGRFVAVVLSGRNFNDSTLHVMVSKTGAPANLSTAWDRYALPAGTTIGAGNGWFDYPGLGVSPDALVVSGNVFSNAGTFLGTRLRVFDKPELYDGDAQVSYVDVDQDGSTAGFTIQPAHHFGTPPTGTFYLLQRWGPQTLRLWTLTGVPSSPTVTGVNISTNFQGLCVGSAPQKDTSVEIDTVCLRMMDAVWRDGSIWGTLTGSSSARAVVQWFEVSTQPTPTLVQHGVVDGGSGEHTFMPAIAVDACGNAALTYSQSSTNHYPEIRYTAHKSGDPPGSVESPVVVLTSPGYYDDFTDSPERWGDYAAANIDPTTGRFWIAQEYVETAASPGMENARWGTWHASFDYECAPPTPGPSPTPTVTDTPGPSPTPTATLPFTRWSLPVVARNAAAAPVPDNGDFEQGPVVWTETSTNGFPLILVQGDLIVPTHQGNWAAWLGGADLETSILSQPVTVPTGLPWLTYWHWIASQQTGCGGDVGAVQVNGVSVESYALCTSANTQGWVKRAVSFSPYLGQTVTLSFVVQTDGADNSNLFLDDVTFASVP